jgi:hypothetical protein
MQNIFKTKITVSIFLVFSTILMIIGPLISSEFTSNNFLKRSYAAAVLGCSSNETLSGNLCLTNRTSNPIYSLQCETGYTASEATCIQSTPKTCADYNNAINAETGYCKYDPTKTLYDGQILDYDGRTCKINGATEMWFLRYNVPPLMSGTTNGPVVCANIFSITLVGGILTAPSFRFVPANVTSIHNFITTQTGTTLSPCPTGYTIYNTNQCSRPAINSNCNAGGEIATISNNAISCSICPAGQYCQTTLNTTNQSTCTNGGTLSNISGVTAQKCLGSALKYSYTSYTNGCANGYIKLDQSCAVKQVRDHDIDTCSYFFASSNILKLAVETPAGSKICSTGGSTDFASTDILKTDDTLTCAGVGTGWYNYNVAYDPLVCGYNTYDANNKATFRWSAETYSKVTGLQKIPATSTTCPDGWTEVSTTSQDCYQDPTNLVVRTGTTCTANYYCPEGTTNPIQCPSGYTSLAGSSLLSDCKINPCTNGATNPPNCNNQNTTSSTSSTSSINQANGGVIIITNKSSSSANSSSISSSSSSSSNCTSAQPGYYINGNICSPCQAGYYCPGDKIIPIICPIGYYCPAISAAATICPAGKTTKTEGAKDISECIAIPTVAQAPTPRSGGNQSIFFLSLTFTTVFILYLFYRLNKKRKFQEWK